MISKEQYSNLSCFEELDIRCAMYGHEMSDVVRVIGRPQMNKHDKIYHLVPTISGLIWFYTGKRIDPPDVWAGNLNIVSMGLRSLAGCPKKINGHFDCINNQLTSLEGAPAVVGGDFYCSYNTLTSLKGAPSEVGGGFYCWHNQLTSLSGAPIKVGRSFNCRYNQLTSLSGAPSEVCKDFNCSNNLVKFSKEDVRKVSTVHDCIYS